MKHGLIFILSGVVLVGIGFLLGRLSPISLPPSPPAGGSPSLSQLPASPAGGSNLYLVSRVIDGDTIELENGERVRYIGIDTPETVDPRKPVQCFGVEASTRNKELVEGKRVWLVKDVTDRDRYGRLLRYVYLGDPQSPESIFVNLELVKEGFAHSYSYPPDVAHQEEFVSAERDAREQGRGLWSSCPLPTASDSSFSSSPTLPLSSSPSVVSSNCLIKGNISSTGEKIYHLPGCGSYEKTAIDESRGEQWFCGEDEAVKAGWRKAKNC